MREIKFRAWDSRNGKWFDKNLIYPAISQNGGVIAYKGDEKLYNTEHIIISQFTGLLDKNSKEIYDGDIVKTKDKEVGVVAWREETDPDYAWGWRIKWITSEIPQSLICIISNRPEIIGNIYENPELLK